MGHYQLWHFFFGHIWASEVVKRLGIASVLSPGDSRRDLSSCVHRAYLIYDAGCDEKSLREINYFRAPVYNVSPI